MSAHARRADACTLREVVQWRRQSARLAMLLRADPPAPSLAAEAFALQRECEHLASDLRALAEVSRIERRGGSA